MFLQKTDVVIIMLSFNTTINVVHTPENYITSVLGSKPFLTWIMTNLGFILDCT